PLWEMSSFSEASMAAAQLVEVLADTLLSECVVCQTVRENWPLWAPPR
ncbi:hypothetical protein SAMN03159318_05611, partial [Pseudomonas sp. NFACC42-2]